MEDAPRPYRVPTVLAVIKLVVLVALIVLPFLKPVEYLQYVVIMAILILGGVYYVVFTRFELVFPGSRRTACFVQKLLMCVPCVNELELMLKEKL
uniref:Putative amino acid transporter n=1 Tax=Ixodes ricinus TaxID=34613 RepID=A0A0K8RDV9_IXORI